MGVRGKKAAVLTFSVYTHLSSAVHVAKYIIVIENRQFSLHCPLSEKKVSMLHTVAHHQKITAYIYVPYLIRMVHCAVEKPYYSALNIETSSMC